MAAACLHVRAGREAPARRLLFAANARLGALPEESWGIDLDALRRTLSAVSVAGPLPAAGQLASLLQPRKAAAG